MKPWLKRLYICLFNFHSQVWIQFCGQTGNRWKPICRSINDATFCSQVSGEIRKNSTDIQKISKQHVALGSGVSHGCDQLSGEFTTQSMEDAKCLWCETCEWTDPWGIEHGENYMLCLLFTESLVRRCSLPVHYRSDELRSVPSLLNYWECTSNSTVVNSL